MKQIKVISTVIQGAWHEGLFKAQEFLRNTKYAYQRARYRYDDEMLWHFNSSYAEVMIEILTRIKDEGRGYPFGMRLPDWKKAISDMISGFEAAVEICEDIGGEKNRKELEKTFRKGMRLFVKHYFDLWD
jgi:hypothetical protein